jgi:hypothetical protein
MNNQEIKEAIKDLKDGLNSKFTPEQFKPRMEAKIKELESQLSSEPKQKSYTEKLSDIDKKVKNTSEKEKRATYVQVFGEEYDSPKRKQTPLPLDLAYKVALNSLKNKEKEQLAKGITKKLESKKQTETSITEKLKKSVPVSKASTKYAEDEDGYCDKVIAQAKERRAKAKARSLEPQKTEGTKNKEKIEKVVENVKERAENDSISVSELKKLISETEQLLNVLKSRLAKMK